MLLKICNFVSRWMAVIVLLAAVVSLVWPQKVGVIPTSWINWLLGVVMFGMGLTLKMQDFKIVFLRPKDILAGCLAQFCIMPLLALGLSRVFGLPEDLAVGVILVGCCPGGTASNVITYLAGGDLALSVGMTSVSTLLAPLLTPLLVWALAGTMVDVNVWNMFLSIVQVILLPIAVGLLVKRFFPRMSDRMSAYLPAFSSLAIAFIVAIIVAANATRLYTSGLLVLLVVVLHNVLGFLFGYFFARLLKLNHTKRIAVCVEVGMQNSGLACSLAQQHFAHLAMATVPGAIFSVWHNVAGSFLAHLFKRNYRSNN